LSSCQPARNYERISTERHSLFVRLGSRSRRVSFPLPIPRSCP